MTPQEALQKISKYLSKQNMVLMEIFEQSFGRLPGSGNPQPNEGSASEGSEMQPARPVLN